MIDVVMPQMGESIVEGTLTKWLKKPGETVGRDEPLFEISTDKVDTEIPSPAAGTLAEVLIEEGKTVGINTIVARHFVETALRASIGERVIGSVFEELRETVTSAVRSTVAKLPKNFPEEMTTAIQLGINQRLKAIPTN